MIYAVHSIDQLLAIIRSCCCIFVELNKKSVNESQRVPLIVQLIHESNSHPIKATLNNWYILIQYDWGNGAEPSILGIVTDAPLFSLQVREWRASKQGII